MRHTSLRLPLALAALALPLVAVVAAAQRAVSTSTPLLATPGGNAVAMVRRGTELRVGRTRGDYAQVTLEGYVSADLLGGERDTFSLSVKSSATGVRLREAPNGSASILAELRGGMGLTRVSRRGDWVRVRRTGWVSRRALRGEEEPVVAQRNPRAQRTPRPPPRAQRADATTRTAAGSVEVQQAAEATTRTDTVVAPLPADAFASTATVTLRGGPDGRTIGSVSPTAVLTPTARERGWIRVRVEGWVRESEIVPADSSLRASLSAADLRADPEGTRGKIVRWDIEVLAFQTADPLRKGLAPDEPYLLARGPGDENALLYLAVPPSLVSVARSLPALAPITITARVRTGRSEPVGVPILDIQTLIRR